MLKGIEILLDRQHSMNDGVNELDLWSALLIAILDESWQESDGFSYSTFTNMMCAAISVGLDPLDGFLSIKLCRC